MAGRTTPQSSVGRKARRAGEQPARIHSARMLHWEMLVRMVGAVRLVRAPTVGPDLCRAQQLPASAQDDSERLVVEDQGETRHGKAFPVVGYCVANARAWPHAPSGNALSGNALLDDAYPPQVTISHSDTFIAVSS